MFMLYAVPVGLVLGLLLGGRISGLARLQFRWAWVAIAGFAVQLALFSAPISDRVGAWGPPIYVASTLVVLVAVVRNAVIPGLPIVALGAASNLAAIVANGGYMPAAPGALAALSRGEATTYSNSAVIEAPALEPLTDLFAMPRWMPFANVFSVGDVLIAIGIVVVIVVAMTRPAPVPAARGRMRPSRCVREPPPPDGAAWYSRVMGGGRSSLVAFGPEVRHASATRDRPGQIRREAETQSQGSRQRDRPTAGTATHPGGNRETT